MSCSLLNLLFLSLVKRIFSFARLNLQQLLHLLTIASATLVENLRHESLSDLVLFESDQLVILNWIHGTSKSLVK